MKPLKNAVNDFIEQEHLTEEQLQQLISQQTTVSASPYHPRRTSRLSRLIIATACLLIGFSIALHYVTVRQTPDITQLIASEVAKNHIKMKPLEIKSQSMTDIQGYFKQLDFSPVSSQALNPSIRTMLGGRYCSIQGVTAAQLRYQGEDGQLYTFYETLYDEATFTHIPHVDRGESPIEVYTKGLKVKIWVEKGLLMALVHSE